ncbi:MAG: alpha/beta hydrolase [Actinobacteria bacterium]|nr:MAG: alpha/beta hydrolase [Actinomycetota bacterium]
MTAASSDDYGPQGRSAWLDIDWRSHQRWVRVEDRWANVIEIGSGPPVVFVHGLGGSWQNWLENLPATAEAGYRAIAVDLPGFGASEMPREKISISGYGRWVDSLCDALGTGPVALVGNSMGGFIGCEVAIKFPPRVERLVLVSAAGITIEHQRNDAVMGTLYRTERISKFLATWLAAHADGLSTRPRLRKALLRFVMAHPDRLPGPLISEQVRGSGKAGFLPALEALTSYPIRERLPEVACPTLIVWGADDRLVPRGDADTFEELIPDSRKVVFEDTGHVAMLERPARFNRLVLDFLAEPPGEEVDETSEAAVGN